MWVNRFQIQGLFKKLFRPAEISFFHHEAMQTQSSVSCQEPTPPAQALRE
jgi:hypothetical protein